MLLSVISATLLDMYLFQDSFNLLLILYIPLWCVQLWCKGIVCVCSALSFVLSFFLSNTLAQLSVTTFGGVEKEDFFFVPIGKQDQDKATIRALITVSSITQKCKGWRWFDANCLGRRVFVKLPKQHKLYFSMYCKGCKWAWHWNSFFTFTTRNF